jgi:hypothetical protein
VNYPIEEKCYNCDRRATRGSIGNKPSHCDKHYDKRTEIVKPIRPCRIEGCNELAFYGNTYPIYCKTHSNSYNFSFIPSTCSVCHFPAIIDKNEHCCFCNVPTKSKEEDKTESFF